MQLEIDPAVAGRVRLGVIEAAPVAAGAGGRSLQGEIAAASAALRQRYAGRTPGEIEGARHARTLYRAFGIDPTRSRPSSESLLRRVLRGEPLPEILGAVDLGNLCSLDFLLPIGLYDRGRITAPVTLREGRPGECYRGIGKPDVQLAGRPVLADAHGAFGNPTSDSWRCRVTEQTTELWMVLFAPASYPGLRLRRHVDDAIAALGRHLVVAPAARLAGRLLPADQ